MPSDGQRKRPPAARTGAKRWPVKRLVSAGGIVVRGAGDSSQVALIRHRTIKGAMVWTVPKGALEAGESVGQAALREVREETGLEAEIVEELQAVSYWFSWPPDEVRYHKTVHLFLMRCTGGDTALHDDEVEEVRFFALADALQAASYASERKVLREAAGHVGGW